jgi:hypothetical protein
MQSAIVLSCNILYIAYCISISYNDYTLWLTNLFISLSTISINVTFLTSLSISRFITNNIIAYCIFISYNDYTLWFRFMSQYL